MAGKNESNTTKLPKRFHKARKNDQHKECILVSSIRAASFCTHCISHHASIEKVETRSTFFIYR